MKLRQYGYVIFGNRTLYKFIEAGLGNRSALQELSVRLTANEIKRAITSVAISLTFESNTYLTWLAFKSQLEPTLADMKVKGGLIDYEIIMDETTTTAADISNNTVNGIVRVNIARTAENFEISFELAAAGVTFNNEL
jgi:phage tail sheath protein FI